MLAIRRGSPTRVGEDEHVGAGLAHTMRCVEYDRPSDPEGRAPNVASRSRSAKRRSS